MSTVYGFGIELYEKKLDLSSPDTCQRLAHMFASLLEQSGCYSKFHVHVNKDYVGFEIEKPDDQGEFDSATRQQKLKDVYQESYEGLSHL